MLADLARQVDATLPMIRRAFAEEALIDARAAWPVKTGESKASLMVRTDKGGNVSIICDVKYASFIHQKGSRGPAWEVLIVKHAQQNAEALGRRAMRRLGGV